jgi:chemotaxis protein methyltransferase CheR
MFTVSLPEANTLIRAIKKANGTDLSGLSMASFRFHLSQVLQSHKLENIESLTKRILTDPDYFDRFMIEITADSSDMFRDPDLWIHLRDDLLPIFFASWRYPEIVIPQCVNGDELYTMAIFLKETGLDYRVDLVATCLNETIKKQILKGELHTSKYKNSKDNFDVYNPDSSFDKYIETKQGNKYLKEELLEGLEIKVQDHTEPTCSEKTALVIYRNRMLLQNAEMQYRTLKQLLGDMKKGTCFIVGIGESIDGFGFGDLYTEVSEDLKIYIKKDVL